METKKFTVTTVESELVTREITAFDIEEAEALAVMGKGKVVRRDPNHASNSIILHSSTGEEYNPGKCISCGSHYVVARDLNTEDMTVGMLCSQCHHEWTEQLMVVGYLPSENK